MPETGMLDPRTPDDGDFGRRAGREPGGLLGRSLDRLLPSAKPLLSCFGALLLVWAIAVADAHAQEFEPPPEIMDMLDPDGIHVFAPDMMDKKIPEDHTGAGLVRDPDKEPADDGPGQDPVALATPASGNFICLYPSSDPRSVWSYVASYPAGYVTGNCRDGWHLHRTQKSNVVRHENDTYEGGQIFGDFQGCGWVRSQMSIMVGGGSWGACQDPSRNANTFAYVMNCPPGMCSTGTLSSIKKQCDIYANVRPWSANGVPVNWLRTVYPGQSRLDWRYVTRYWHWGQHWAMVWDSWTPSGQGNWGFVPGDCIDYPQGPGGYWWPT